MVKAMGEPRTEQARNLDVVYRYLRVFVTRDLTELAEVMAGDVEIYGAGQHVQGRHNVEAAICAPGLTVTSQRLIEVFAARDRVIVVIEQAYCQGSTGKTAVQSACKMYQLRDGKIVRFWGEADSFGLLRGLDLLPAGEIDLTSGGPASGSG